MMWRTKKSFYILFKKWSELLFFLTCSFRMILIDIKVQMWSDFYIKCSKVTKFNWVNLIYYKHRTIAMGLYSDILTTFFLLIQYCALFKSVLIWIIFILLASIHHFLKNYKYGLSILLFFLRILTSFQLKNNVKHCSHPPSCKLLVWLKSVWNENNKRICSLCNYVFLST